MPAAPSEPEKYSIDEMMDRLKNSSSGGPEDGELVTRQDGTQAIRVRKRKRRSNQPQKEQQQRLRRSRIVQVSGAMLLLFGAAVTVGGAVIYANSGPFRKNLESKIASSSGATIQLTKFRMNPKTANADNLSLEWPAGNLLGKLEVRGIVSEIFPASFLGKSMTGEETTAIQGVLALRIPDANQPARAGQHARSGMLPIRFNKYRISSLDVTLGEPNAPLATLSKSEAALAPANLGGNPELSLYQGKLVVPGWPALRIDRSLVEFRGDEADISSFRVMHATDNRGTMDLDGTIAPYKPDQVSTLNVELAAFQLSGLTSDSFGKLVSGRVETRSNTKSNYLTFFPSEQPSAVLDVSFQSSPSSEFSIQGFPFLLGLANTLGDNWFERPIFSDESNGVLRRENGTVTLKELNLANKARMVLRGNISLSPAERLSGTLEVGITETMIASARTRQLENIFGPPRDGFRWVKIDIGGTTMAPTDSFKDLLGSPAMRPSAEPESGSSFDDLTRPR